MVQLGTGRGAQPFDTVEDYEAWLGRVEDFEAWVDQAIENMRKGIDRGVVQPRVLMKRVLPQLRSQVVDKAEASAFYRPVKHMPDSFAQEQRRRLRRAYRKKIENVLVPAYRRLHRFVKEEYIPEARETHGLGALPNGAAWYRYRVRATTTTDLAPARIHRIGRKEVKRLQGEIRDLKRKMGFEGDLQAFFTHMKSAEKYHFESAEALLDGYRAIRRRVERNVGELFRRIPDADYEIREVEEFREESFTAAAYRAGPPDGSRPGIFYVNTHDLASRPRWEMEALFLHEAVPGHHHQIALQRRLELPRFRRFGGNTAYQEGWALYAEGLGKALGLYETPADRFGRLQFELWRAIRLVVDTGLHAKGWSRKRVIGYMQENFATSESRAVAEAERYMALPAQALGYKIGERKIRRLRARAREALGDRFDLSGFHEQILGSGPLPLDLLEKKVDRWIRRRQG